MFTDKMTVYNHYNNGYNRHVVEHIMWRHVREQTVVANNVISKENSEHITIDCSKVLILRSVKRKQTDRN